MLSKNKKIYIDVINLKMTDEELALLHKSEDLTEEQKGLINALLDAVSRFLDEEEKRGFMEQTHVDVIISVEDMLQRLILGKPDRYEISIPQSKSIKSPYSLDNDESDSEIHIKNQKHDMTIDL